MVSRKEDESQIDGSRAKLHHDGIREVASGSFGISLARECGRELKCRWSGDSCGMSRHGRTCYVSVANALDPWVHPFRAVLRQFLIEAPQVGMVVIELC